MQNISTDIQTTSITTVRAIEISFTKEGEDYTAEFTSTSNYDATTDHTEQDMQIINQIALPALTDEEEKELWDKAHDLVNEQVQDNDSETHTAIMSIDWKLLRKQKSDFGEISISETDYNKDDEEKSISGIISLIDRIQDAVVADGLFTEETVFGTKEPEEVNILGHIDTDAPAIPLNMPTPRITSFDEFLKIPRGSIMSTGVITDPRLHKSEVRWIAKKGDSFDDWAIYYHHSTYPIEYIKNHGDKCTREAVIRMLFPCDDAVYARYRR